MRLADHQSASPSPDERFYVLTTSEEVRMSHWIDVAELRDAANDGLVVAVGSSSWSAGGIAWSPDGAEVAMAMRRYPGDHDDVSLRLLVHAGRARVRSRDGEEDVPFAELSDALERAYAQSRWRRAP